jgi:hypothetical protein
MTGIRVVPSVDEPERRALERALELAGEVARPMPGRGRAWWLAGLHEAVEAFESSGDDYVLSPRSTRGATRA